MEAAFALPVLASVGGPKDLLCSRHDGQLEVAGQQVAS